MYRYHIAYPFYTKSLLVSTTKRTEYIFHIKTNFQYCLSIIKGVFWKILNIFIDKSKSY